MKAVFIYVTVPSDAEAQNIAGIIVRERLAACANIIPGMTSVYLWEGRLEERGETIVVFKTRAGLFPAVEARVKNLHSDKTPCIAAMPLSDVSEAFLHWLYTETLS